MRHLMVIHRILTAIEKYEQTGDRTVFEPKNLDIETCERERDWLLTMLVKAGYVGGVKYAYDYENNICIGISWPHSKPCLTLAGLEYLEASPVMKTVGERLNWL